MAQPVMAVFAHIESPLCIARVATETLYYMYGHLLPSGKRYRVEHSMVCMTVKHLHKCGYLYCDTRHRYARTDKNCVCVQDEELEKETMNTSPVKTTIQSSTKPADGTIVTPEHKDDELEIESTPASLEQCLRFLEIKKQAPHIVAVHVIRLNAVDVNRPKDTVLVDSGAECNVGNDIRKFISRISDTNTEVTFTDGSDSMRVEGIGTVREWYYDWRGHVFVDEYEAFYCPTAKYPIRSEQELRLKGWRVIRNPTRHGVDVKRKGPDGQEQILPVPRLD